MPTDRVLILSPVKTVPRVYQLKPIQTPLQKSSISTSVIQTLQLQKNPQNGSEKTYDIKYNSTYNNFNSNSAIGQRSSNSRFHPEQQKVPSHSHLCRNEPYAQCKSCSCLTQLSKLSDFVCQTCRSSSTAPSTPGPSTKTH